MRTGLDRIAQDAALAKRLRGRKVGLLAHPASVTREFVHARLVLAELGALVRVVFGPEHGYGGEAQDMIGVSDARDAFGTPIRSLYGETFEDTKPRQGDLEGLDVVLVDLQDVGARYYTFVWTAVLMMRACDQVGVALLVADRPNPLGHDRIEGHRQDPEFLSFVGLEPIPVRHSLTLGQIVAWRAQVEGIRVPVEVVRHEGEDEPFSDRAFVLPSPNMPTLDTARVYPGGCLLEGTNLSEGRGTTRPFEIVGAPWISGTRLASDLHALGLPGFVARPLAFRPTFHKHAGKHCGGVQIHVTDPKTFRPLATYLALVALARAQDAERFCFRTEPYEFVAELPAIDLLLGSDRPRRAMLEGRGPLDVVRLVDIDHEDHAIVDTAKQVFPRFAL